MDPSERRLPAGWAFAINAAILEATTASGGGILPQLLNGLPKALIVRWCGDLQAGTGDFLPYRGDGQCHLIGGEHPAYAVPKALGNRGLDGSWNIRASVPLWLLHPNGGSPIVLACGALHPFFNSATVDHYDPDTGAWRDRTYLSDPRVKLTNPPEDFLDVGDQRWAIKDSGGMLAPTAAPLRPLASALMLEPSLLG